MLISIYSYVPGGYVKVYWKHQAARLPSCQYVKLFNIKTCWTSKIRAAKLPSCWAFKIQVIYEELSNCRDEKLPSCWELSTLSKSWWGGSSMTFCCSSRCLSNVTWWQSSRIISDVILAVEVDVVEDVSPNPSEAAIVKLSLTKTVLTIKRLEITLISVPKESRLFIT